MGISPCYVPYHLSVDKSVWRHTVFLSTPLTFPGARSTFLGQPKNFTQHVSWPAENFDTARFIASLKFYSARFFARWKISLSTFLGQLKNLKQHISWPTENFHTARFLASWKFSHSTFPGQLKIFTQHISWPVEKFHKGFSWPAEKLSHSKFLAQL